VRRHNYSQFTERFEKLQEEHRKALDDLGEDVRQRVVAPACRKHGLTFTSGMGDFFFTVRENGEDVYIHDCEGARDAGFDDLCPIFDLLNQEVSRGDHLGYYVGDVR